jgi:hypothetical protein
MLYCETAEAIRPENRRPAAHPWRLAHPSLTAIADRKRNNIAFAGPVGFTAALQMPLEDRGAHGVIKMFGALQRVSFAQRF